MIWLISWTDEQSEYADNSFKASTFNMINNILNYSWTWFEKRWPLLTIHMWRLSNKREFIADQLDPLWVDMIFWWVLDWNLTKIQGQNLSKIDRVDNTVVDFNDYLTVLTLHITLLSTMKSKQYLNISGIKMII